jgi:hypothetical protein
MLRCALKVANVTVVLELLVHARRIHMKNTLLSVRYLSVCFIDLQPKSKLVLSTTKPIETV